MTYDAGNIDAKVYELSDNYREKLCKKDLAVLLALINGMREADNVDGVLKNLTEVLSLLKIELLIFVEDTGNDLQVFTAESEKVRKFEGALGADMKNPWIRSYGDSGNIKGLLGDSGGPILIAGKDDIFNMVSALMPDPRKKSAGDITAILGDNYLLAMPIAGDGQSIALAVASPEAFEGNTGLLCLVAAMARDEIARCVSGRLPESIYRHLVDNCDDLIILCGGDGSVEYSNHHLYNMGALAGEDVGIPNVFHFFNGSVRERLKKTFGHVLQNGENAEPMEVELESPAGKKLWSEIKVKGFPGKRLQVTAKNITRRKQMEHDSDILSAFQHEILHNEYIGIITMDREGLISSWNRGAVNILGYGQEEMLGMNISDIIVYDSDINIQNFIIENVDSEGQVSQTVAIRHKDGRKIIAMYILSALCSGDVPESLIAYFIDISERVRLEKQSRELITQLNQAQQLTILTLTKLTEYRDIETGSHLERIMKYTELLAGELATFPGFENYITANYIVDLVTSAPLHDIGKVAIPDHILHKPGIFTPEEYEVMKKHTTIGGNSILEAEKRTSGRSFLNLGKEVVFYHHERWDGSGYPRGLKGDDIPLSARIVALADVYDAITTKRTYKEAYPHHIALDIIASGAWAHFDGLIVRAFLNVEKEFHRWKDIYL